MSSPSGTPVERSMTSMRMGASHLAFRTSFTRYLGAKLTLQRLCGLCSHRTHCGSRQPRLLRKGRPINCSTCEEIQAGGFVQCPGNPTPDRPCGQLLRATQDQAGGCPVHLGQTLGSSLLLSPPGFTSTLPGFAIHSHAHGEQFNTHEA